MEIIYQNAWHLFAVISKIIATITLYAMTFGFGIPASAFQGQIPSPAMELNLNKEYLEHYTDSIATVLLEKDLLPGMTVALAKDGKLIFAKGYGKADIELNVPATAENIYRIGSITKQFTAAMILKLAEEGKLSLDDPIPKYLPDYPTQGHTVTIGNLLNHTSGIKGIRARMVDEETRQRFRTDLTDEEINALFSEAPFDFAPGEGQQYSNSGYLLLGQIISEVSGMPFKDYAEQHFLQPLGLKNTGFDNEIVILPNRAEGYEKEEGVRTNAHFIDMDMPGSAGAFYSTVADLVQWTHLLHSGKVISNESYNAMISPTTYGEGKIAGYGYGLNLNELGGHKKVFHGGMINGFSSFLSHYPEAGISIAVLTNTGGGEIIGSVEKGLAKKALGVKVLDLAVNWKEMTPHLGSYKYKSGEKDREINIFEEKDGLMAQLVGGKPFRLLSQGNKVFIPQVDEDMKLIFTKNELEIHDGPWEKIIAHRRK